jgi:hypothetical protein
MPYAKIRNLCQTLGNAVTSNTKFFNPLAPPNKKENYSGKAAGKASEEKKCKTCSGY